jgi:hypothetical protein
LSRPKAYFINGGAGRVICSIPAFEKLVESGEDFIIVCEGGMDFYKGHPDLHSRAYDNWHKGLFEEHLKHRDIITPEHIEFGNTTIKNVVCRKRLTFASTIKV